MELYVYDDEFRDAINHIDSMFNKLLMEEIWELALASK